MSIHEPYSLMEAYYGVYSDYFEEFVPLSNEKTKRVTNAIEKNLNQKEKDAKELTGHNKRLRSIPRPLRRFSRSNARALELLDTHRRNPKGLNKPQLMQNASDALVKSSVDRSAKLVSQRNELKRKLNDLNEEYALYDLVLDYLFNEGYVDNLDDADALIEELSDEEIENVLDEVTGGGKVDPHNPDPSRGMNVSPFIKAARKQVSIEGQSTRRENEIRRKHKAPSVNPWEDPSDPDYQNPSLRTTQATNRANRAAAVDPKMRRLNQRYTTIGNVMDNMKEELDLYDLVLDHLISEGYVDSEDAAIQIMAHMSEEWVDGIIEEKRKKVKIEVTRPIGYKIADIGPGGKEYNVKTGVSK